MTETTAPSSTFPRLRQVVLDAEDARGLAEFYRQLLGLRYLDDAEGDEGASVRDASVQDASTRDAAAQDASTRDAAAQDADWLVLADDAGSRVLAFQRVASLPAPTWPEGPRPQMMHLDMFVQTREELRQQHERAVALGASVLEDSTDDPDEGIVIFADPAGHPFCIFVPEE